jgi:hypothetical protein
MKAVKKDPPREPIYVRDPKDKRLLAYNDSLRTYQLDKPFKKEIYDKLMSSKTVDEYYDNYHRINNKWKKAGLNPDLYRSTGNVFFEKEFGKTNKQILGEQVVKKPVQPVLLAKEATEANVAPKDLSMPTSSIKVNRAVNFPKTVTGVKYDTQKGDVIVGISGKDVTMPRKEFDSWVNKPENRKMFDDYRKSKAKK